MAINKVLVHKQPTGKYKTVNNGITSNWTVGQPTASSLGINPQSSDSYRIVQRLTRKKTANQYFVKVEKFRYSSNGNPSKVITTLHETDSDFKLAGHNDDSTLTTDFNNAVPHNITEAFINNYTQISANLATGTNWNTADLPAGYGGDTSTGDSTAVTGGELADFNSKLLGSN
jgi:hypothetical protein